MPGRAALTALASLLLGGCFYTPLVDVSDQRPGVRPASFEAAAAADERPIAARGVTMSDARDFAQLLHDYYGATCATRSWPPPWSRRAGCCSTRTST